MAEKKKAKITKFVGTSKLIKDAQAAVKVAQSTGNPAVVQEVVNRLLATAPEADQGILRALLVPPVPDIDPNLVRDTELARLALEAGEKAEVNKLVKAFRSARGKTRPVYSPMELDRADLYGAETIRSKGKTFVVTPEGKTTIYQKGNTPEFQEAMENAIREREAGEAGLRRDQAERAAKQAKVRKLLDRKKLNVAVRASIPDAGTATGYSSKVDELVQEGKTLFPKDPVRAARHVAERVKEISGAAAVSPAVKQHAATLAGKRTSSAVGFSGTAAATIAGEAAGFAAPKVAEVVGSKVAPAAAPAAASVAGGAGQAAAQTAKAAGKVGLRTIGGAVVRLLPWLSGALLAKEFLLDPVLDTRRQDQLNMAEAVLGGRDRDLVNEQEYEQADLARSLGRLSIETDRADLNAQRDMARLAGMLSPEEQKALASVGVPYQKAPWEIYEGMRR